MADLRRFLFHQIPLGNGEFVNVTLPAVMTKEEADRMILAAPAGPGVAT